MNPQEPQTLEELLRAELGDGFYDETLLMSCKNIRVLARSIAEATVANVRLIEEMDDYGNTDYRDGFNAAITQSDRKATHWLGR